MKIYVAHSSSFDFVNDLYAPIKKSKLMSDHLFIFPHEKPGVFVNSKDIIKSCDLVIAEVSYPSTGLGIELGWSNLLNVPILLIYKAGKTPTRALRVLNSVTFSYSNHEDLVEKILNHLLKT